MIDNNATFDKYGYHPAELSHGSGRRIVAVCDVCGKVRELEFRAYSFLCHECAVNTVEYTKQRSIIATGRKCSDATKKKRSKAMSGEKHPNWLGGDITLVCTWCGCTYTRQRGHAVHSRFCSNVCRGKYQSKHARGKNASKWKGGKSVRKICGNCGKEYYAYPREVGRQFCSRSCADAGTQRNGENHPRWKGGYVSKSCEICGVAYSVHVCRQEVSRFCSRECAGKWQSINNRGEKNPSWNGGTSYGKYCEKFSKAFKREVRAKYNNECYLCPKTEEQNGRKMSVHHVSYLKNCLCDDVKCDFVPLCVSCHSKTNHNRFFWQTLITYSLAYEEDYYATPIPNLLILFRT